MKLSVVIRSKNEADRLRLTLTSLALQRPTEVIVVDDGSTDGTTFTLEECRQQHRSIVVHHSTVNVGKGAALRAGIARSSGDIVLVQDGDLEYDPSDYLQLLQPIVDGRADVVYGSRFATGVRGMKRANWIANRVLTHAANVLFAARITDEATAYKAFRAPVLKQLSLRCRRFEFCPEVTAKVRRLGIPIHEVPIRYHPRSIEEGKKIRYSDGVHALWTLLKYRFASSRSLYHAVSDERSPAIAVAETAR